MTINYKNKSQILKIAMILLVFLALGAFIFNRYLRNNHDDAAKEAELLIAEISKTVELPDEIPVVATVSDKNSLSKQAFFSRAENGDKVLIYQNWQKAILYRPSIKKIIDLTSINTDQNQEGLLENNPGSNDAETVDTNSDAADADTDTRVPASHRVALYNGSTVNGLTQISANKLNQEKAVSIVARQNAARSDYTETLVIPLKNTSNSMAIRVAELLSGRVSELPAGEVLPDDAEILVILAEPSQPSQSAQPSPATPG